MCAQKVELRQLVKIFPTPGGTEVRAVDEIDLVIEPLFPHMTVEENIGYGLRFSIFDAPFLDGEAALVVRPEAMSLHDSEGIPVLVENTVYLGSAMEYRVVLPNGERVTIVHSNPNMKRLHKVDQKAFLRLDPHASHLLPAD